MARRCRRRTGRRQSADPARSGSRTGASTMPRSVHGADARVRDFLAQGGAAIGLLRRRVLPVDGPAGLDRHRAGQALYTHEYLQSGVGVVTLEMRKGPLALGSPADDGSAVLPRPDLRPGGAGHRRRGNVPRADPRRAGLPSTIRSTATSSSATWPATRRSCWRRRSRPRRCCSRRIRRWAISIRKYIALDGYVRHYLPIRGVGTMRDDAASLPHLRFAQLPPGAECDRRS